MPRRRSVAGSLVQYERPNWKPLLLVAPDIVGAFMWMHEVGLADGVHVHAFKHRITRRYLHLTEDGWAYGFRPPNRYVRVPIADLLEEALGPLWELPLATDDELAASTRALEQARRATC